MIKKTKYLFFFSCLVLVGACQSKKNNPDVLETPTGKWELVWQDEFDYTGLPDSTKWSFDIDGNSWRWGNNEDQWYTEDRPENAYVSDGILTITANVENWEDREYTSARLRTLAKGDWKYGRIEVSAQVPSGKGTWSAIWMLPSDQEYGGWPQSGEIDIMEYVGRDPGTLFSTVHTGSFNHIKNTQVGDTIIVPDITTKFHTYVLEWEENEMRSYIDGSLYFTFKKVEGGSDAWPFDRPFHLLINLAIGGNLGGEVDKTLFPQKMLVDYVRVYRKIE